MANKLLAYSRLKPGGEIRVTFQFVSRTLAFGCDTDKAVLNVCVIRPIAEGSTEFESLSRQYSNSPSGCAQIRKWLLSYIPAGIDPKTVPFIVESTGPYHVLVVKALKDIFDVIVINPYRVRALLKTEGKDDIVDGRTLARLGLSWDLKRSLIVVGVQEELRSLLRMERRLINGRTQVSNRIGSLLTQHAIPLANVVKVTSKSGRAMITAIAAGETDPIKLTLLWEGRHLSPPDLRKLHAEGANFTTAVEQSDLSTKDKARLLEIYDVFHYLPDLTDNIRWMVAQQVKLLETFDVEIEATRVRIEEAIKRYCLVDADGVIVMSCQQAIDIILTAPIFSRASALRLLAEVGLDLADKFGTADSLCRALGLTAGNLKSGGKVIGMQVTPGNAHVAPLLIQGATTFLRRTLSAGETGYALWVWGRGYQARVNAPSARVAVARKVLASVWHMFRKGGVAYDDAQHVAAATAASAKIARSLRQRTAQLGAVVKDDVTMEELRLAHNALSEILGAAPVTRFSVLPFVDGDIDALKLPMRVVNCLRRASIMSLSSLVLKVITDQLSTVKGIGSKSADEILNALVQGGYVKENGNGTQEQTTQERKPE